LAGARWRAAAAFVVPLVLVKEDLGLTMVAPIGIYLFYRRQRRLGAALCVLGCAATAITVLAVIPALNPGGVYTYLDQAGGTPAGLLSPVKARTVLMLLLPSAFAAARSPLLLLAVPSLACRFSSTTEAHWGTGLHYNAILMPIVFAAFLDALRSRPGHRTVAAALGICAVMLPFLPLAGLISPTAYRPAPARRVLALVPDGATIAASNRLAPQLTDRTTVSLFPENFQQGVHPEWIAVLTGGDTFPGTLQARRSAIATLPAQGYRRIIERSGIALYRAFRDP
jgi:uncharacterized membrane protein